MSVQDALSHHSKLMTQTMEPYTNASIDAGQDSHQTKFQNPNYRKEIAKMETYDEAVEAAKKRDMEAHVVISPGLYIHWNCVETNPPPGKEPPIFFHGVEAIGKADNSGMASISEDINALMIAWGSVMVSIAELKVKKVNINYEDPIDLNKTTVYFM
ncbi:MAG: hypothetical protein CL793_06565 [Chloroflexi bacterium]|nr:hypothetical protein [Chloroflexota bacterium]|tara:strand:- start:3581 stop:4051 length:471 start_codon:yes stop_codon:yes gene_type:complete